MYICFLDIYIYINMKHIYIYIICIYRYFLGMLLAMPGLRTARTGLAKKAAAARNGAESVLILRRLSAQLVTGGAQGLQLGLAKKVSRASNLDRVNKWTHRAPFGVSPPHFTGSAVDVSPPFCWVWVNAFD